jgi:hypothetical protein
MNYYKSNDTLRFSIACPEITKYWEKGFILIGMNNMDVTRRYTLRLCLAGAIFIYALWRLYRVSHDIRYTVATTTGRISTPRNHFAIKFQFKVNNKLYSGSGSETSKYNIRYPNGRYYVKFPYKSPAACEIQWDRPVPDSITVVPPDGWKELP